MDSLITPIRNFFKKTLALDLLIFSAIIFSGFIPILLHDFAFRNDLGIYFKGSPGHDFVRFLETGHLILVGRPLGAILLYIHTFTLRFFTGIETFAYSRLVALIFLIALGGVIDWILIRRSGWSRSIRILFLSVLFLQPSWLIASVWVTTMIPGIVSYLFGVIGGIVFTFRKEISQKCGRSERFYWVLSGVIAGLNFLVYPPGVFAFIWVPVLTALFDASEHRRKEMIRATGVVFVGSVFFFLNHLLWIKKAICSTKFSNCWTWIEAGSTEYQMHLAQNLGQKFTVITKMLALLGGSWFTTLNGFQMGFAVVTLVAFLAAGWKLTQGMSTFKRIPAAIGGALGLILVLCSPNLLSSSHTIVFRTIAPMVLFLAILAVILALRIKNQTMRLVFAVLVIASLIGLSHHEAEKFSAYYEGGWKTLSGIPKMPEYCMDRQNLMNFVDAFVKTPGGYGYFVGRSDATTHSFDFGDPVFTDWSMSGLCMLLKEPGSPFENAQPNN